MNVRKEEKLLGKEEHLVVRKQHLVHRLERETEPKRKEVFSKELLETIQKQLKLERKEVKFDPELEKVEKRRRERLDEQVRFLNENNLQKLKLALREEEDMTRKLELHEEAKEPKRNFHIPKPAMAIAVVLILALIIFVPGKLMAMGSKPVKEILVDNYNPAYRAVTLQNLEGVGIITSHNFIAFVNEKDSTIVFKLQNQVVGSHEVFYSREGKLIAYLTKNGRVLLGEPPVPEEEIKGWRNVGSIKAIDSDAKILEEKYKNYKSP